MKKLICCSILLVGVIMLTGCYASPPDSSKIVPFSDLPSPIYLLRYGTNQYPIDIYVTNSDTHQYSDFSIQVWGYYELVENKQRYNDQNKTWDAKFLRHNNINLTIYGSFSLEKLK